MRATWAAALLAGLTLAGCKVKVNDGGSLPGVDVREKAGGTTQIEVRPGTMPDVDVQADSVKLPHVDLPDVKLPEVKAPDVHLPRVNGRDTARHDTTRRG